MPVVDGKHYDYSPKGIAMAQAAAKKKGVKLQYKKEDSKMALSKGGGRKGKAKGAPRPGGRRNGGEVMAPPTSTARRTRAPAAGAGLSKVQQNMLRGAQQTARESGTTPKIQELTAKHGQLLKPREGRRAMLPGAPAPGGMKRGGKVGYNSPGNSGLYGRK